MRPQWEWEITGPDGVVLDRPSSPTFATRYDAEEWLGAQWRALRERGAVTVVLRDDGRLVLPAYQLDAPGL